MTTDSPSCNDGDSSSDSSSVPERENHRQPPGALVGFAREDIDSIYNQVDNDADIGNTPSVLVHMLSQVGFGMDLTKVSLPTNILERRSLLEFYASFFKHADLFVGISEAKNPQDRMIAMTRWYLSAFHISLKPNRPKKPYNPILGEIFKCIFRLDEDETTNFEDTISDGPVPWAKPSDLAFIAEQVSHHPPVSAFYAECPQGEISCTADIYTKTQFRGIYASVHLVGKGKIHLHRHNEIYECTFPTLYIRNLFTQPWMEFGDSIKIECEKTGYSCDIDFMKKSYFSSATNHIRGHIKKDGTKLLKLSGQWNDVIYMEHIADKKQNKAARIKHLFDVKLAKDIPMVVQPVQQQQEFESRRLWSDVTLELYRKNLDIASKRRAQIENIQRNAKKERDELNKTWNCRIFREDEEDDSWWYPNNLNSRHTKKSSKNAS